MWECVYICMSYDQKHTGSAGRTQFSTQKADSVVLTQAVRLVLVPADKTIVLVVLVDQISGLVARYTIMGFSLNTRITRFLKTAEALHQTEALMKP